MSDVSLNITFKVMRVACRFFSTYSLEYALIVPNGFKTYQDKRKSEIKIEIKIYRSRDVNINIKVHINMKKQKDKYDDKGEDENSSE